MVARALILLSSSQSWQKLQPLWGACRQGREEVVKQLVARDDVNPDKPDNKEYNTTLEHFWQLAWGVVKRLLEQNDVNPDKRDNNAKTPLWRAAWDRHERVVNLLFGRDDVNPDKPDTDGGTPVLWAS